MSENSDALIIIVSEETGAISVAENGELFRELNKQRLENILVARLLPKSPSKHHRRPPKTHIPKATPKPVQPTVQAPQPPIAQQIGQENSESGEK
jgi:hypothetical protein